MRRIYICAVWLSFVLAGGVAYLVEGVRWGMRRIYIYKLEWTRAFNAREVSWLRVSGFGLGGFERPFETIFEV